ncbi:nuclease domain-containing protein [Prevotella dentasini]|uniref:nuclease domain-containing protein n=1 Tax=Prevotella dentasini TaxID=589537 RepID=UPI001F23B627|nr:nuclease domain-containing protein [Prevotella dentasini]
MRHLLGLNADEVEHRNRTELSGMFTWTLGKGGHSRILFRKDDVELAELIYNPKHVERENDIVSISYLVSPTVAQKPDIVLQLTKNDLSRGMKMTYLFDAKYRIDGKAGSVDIPPEDAINQMHRYRDAIYYREYDAAPLKKEVIGGYILFPGGGEPADVEVSKFYKTIGEVNIGAFPLRPNDGRNRRLLEDFIRSLIERKSTETISQVIPQKGTFVEVGDRVLVGLVKPNSRRGYLDGFKDGKAVRYYTGSHFPTTIALQDLHFFVPYVKGLGIRDVYEITRIRTIAASEVKQTEGDGAAVNDIRLTFELKFSRRLSDGWQRIDTHGMIDYTFFDTTFEGIGQLMGL